MRSDREFDIVLQGATGFTGRRAALELASRAPAALRWAVVGRSEERVRALGEEIGVPWIVANNLKRDDVDGLASRARVVLTTAGPFSRYGTLLVDACVRHQTHYADLTGELPWIDEVIARHHATCVEQGTTLIPCAGFDSAPTDLAVLELRKEVGGTVPIHGFVSMRGGVNGGTLHSGLALGEQGALHPDAAPSEVGRPSVFAVPELGGWAAPFLMAPVNEYVVRRTELLLRETADASGRYSEYLICRSRLQAHSMSGLLSLVNGMLASRLGRSVLRVFGPSPGKGPSERSIERGFARFQLMAGPLEAPIARRDWRWSGDPSNLITVRCLVQVGLALAQDEADRGGVLTPASALGLPLLERLQAIGAVSESTPARAD